MHACLEYWTGNHSLLMLLMKCLFKLQNVLFIQLGCKQIEGDRGVVIAGSHKTNGCMGKRGRGRQSENAREKKKMGGVGD